MAAANRPYLVSRTARLRRLASIAVATAFLVAFEPAAPQAGGRWSPWGEIQGSAGSDFKIDADLFAPLWQREAAMLFLDLRGSVDDDEEIQGHAGLGYRRLFGDWLASGYAYFDVAETEHDHTFLQGSLGVELMNEDWDFRINGYFPESQDKTIGDYRLALVNSPTGGQTLQFRGRQERALGGGDFEVGWRPPILRDQENAELRVFAGGFYRDASGYDALIGPAGRLELRLFDLPFLPQGSRLTTGAELRWDDERDTWGGAFVRLRIPFHVLGLGGEKLAGMDRRMVDRPVREGIIARSRRDERTPYTPVGGPVGDVAYADGATEGDARSVPTAGEIETAIGVAGAGGIIVALDQTGPIDPVNGNQTIELLPGQILMGGGSSVTLANGSLRGVFTAPGGRGLFQTADEIVHLQLTDDNVVQSIDLDGGSTGVQVFGDRVSVTDVGIENVASVSPGIDAMGVYWIGHDGRMQDVRIGDVTSLDAGFSTRGVAWRGDRGWLSDVSIGNVSASGGGIASALSWLGDDAIVRNVAAGNVRSGSGDARALWIEATSGTFEQILIGDVTSASEQARGIDFSPLGERRLDLRDVGIGDVAGGSYADGIFWAGGEGEWSNIAIGNVTANDVSANGVQRNAGTGGRLTNFTVGNVTGGVGAGAGLRTFGAEDFTFSNFTIGDVAAATDGFGFGIVASLGGRNNIYSNGTIGNVSGTGSGNAAVGVRLSGEIDTVVSNLSIGNVTLLDSGGSAFQGARGIDEFGSTRSLFRDVSVGDVTAIGPNTNAWGVFWGGSGGTATRIAVGGVTAADAGSFAYGVEVSGDGNRIEDVVIDDVSGPNEASTSVIRIFGGNANEINLVRVPTNSVAGNGVFFDLGPALDNVGANNSATLLGFGVASCVDSGGSYTGSAIQFNAVNFCP